MILKKLKDKTGAVSIYVIIIMTVLLPFVIWVGIELPKMHENNQLVKDAVDSSSASTITLIDDSGFSGGKVYLKKGEIITASKEIFGSKMGLKYNEYSNEYIIDSKSGISKNPAPNVIVTVIDETELAEKGEYTVHGNISNWSKTITNPTVIIEAEVTFKKIGVFGKNVTINQVGMSQAVFTQPNPKGEE